MTQQIPADDAQTADAAVWEMRFDNPDIDTFLHEAISEFVDELGTPGRGLSWAITLLRADGSQTLAAGSAASEAVDSLQSAFDQGPTLAAVSTGEFVLITDMRRERRWPGYASAAASLDIRSALSVPLVPAPVFRAAFNLYAPLPHVFTSSDITAAARFVRHASWTLRLAQQAGRRDQRSEELTSARLARTLAPLAVRALVREYGFTVEESLEFLRRAAGNLPQPKGHAVPASLLDLHQTVRHPWAGARARAAEPAGARTDGLADPALADPALADPAPEKTA